jgi:enoyl-CoA hydratase/carnithine racemase
MLDAELLDAGEACRRGLVHQSLPLSDLLPAAMSAAEQLSSLDASAYALAKASSRRRALQAIEDDDGRRLDQQVRDQWPDPQAEGLSVHRTVRKNSCRSSPNSSGCSMAAK